jgi:hypothetical protein
MKTFKVKAYDAVIQVEDVEYDVQIGVVEAGTPIEAYLDSWIDPRIYYTVEAHELPELKAGYGLDEGTKLVSIDTDNHSIMEADYDPAEYDNDEEALFQ